MTFRRRCSTLAIALASIGFCLSVDAAVPPQILAEMIVCMGNQAGTQAVAIARAAAFNGRKGGPPAMG